MRIEPDTKDWTWVLRERCPECGFAAAQHRVEDLPELLRDTTARWTEVLARRDVGERPDPTVWSPLEYACHVRDVHAVFSERVSAILNEDEPRFANWDQDLAAIEGAYADQAPADVDLALIEAAGHVAGLYSTVTESTRDRRGVRSNGSEFTIESLGQYHLHDVVHHLHDVVVR